MKKIQILGPGCHRCKTLTENAEAAAKALRLEYQIEKITDIKEIIKAGITMTPGLVVDGVIKSSGRVPSTEEIKALLA